MGSVKAKKSVLIDNRGAKMADYLARHLGGAEIFRLVSAYFSIYGFEALREQLCKPSLKNTKFLFGDPGSVGEVVSGEKQQRSFNLKENGLSVKYTKVLQQRQLAEQCAEWIKQNNVEIRTITQSNFLHGKMYHTTNPDGSGVATVGSSNFTRRGLGLSENPNLEINLATENTETHEELKSWFDKIWNDKTLTEDAKRQVLDVLENLYRENAPEFVYYKTLYELFRDKIEKRAEEDSLLENTHLYDSEIWKTLYEFQKDGAKSTIARLQRHNGCILADSVGLGKTYTALAVIKFFELRNATVLVLCPKKLENNWRVYQAVNNQSGNPFLQDKFSYTLLTHTDLSRDSGMSGGTDLANFKWGNYDLVVIDESHNFRNNTKSRKDPDGNIIRMSRYEKLIKDIIQDGVKTKVLMLSATPVNTSLLDLRNQIYLMTRGLDDHLLDSLGVGNIGAVIKDAQNKFKQWEERQDQRLNKENLLKELGGDFLHLLDGVTLARSRKQIRKFYKGFIEEEGDFPKRKKPDNRYPHTDTEKQLSYENLHSNISALKFRFYQPSLYVIGPEAQQRLDAEKEEHNFNQKDREIFLAAMMRINFLKRLESSAHAFTLTLERTAGKIDVLIDKIKKYQQKNSPDKQTVECLPDDEEDDEEFLVNRNAIHPYKLSELNVELWKQNIQSDRRVLQQILDKIQTITPQRDGKLQLIKKELEKKAAQKNRKLLIFTAFKDTAEYLYENLAETGEKLGLNLALVCGDLTRTGYGKNTFGDILYNFAPQTRPGRSPKEQIDILIATDCISEGQNLQDCDTVLNYDIHWNPVRLIQRFGRIDRIGSKNLSVNMINFWPTKDMNLYLKLENRVRARMALVDATATGDDNSLDEAAFKEAAKTELNFRDRQIERIREEIIDFEEASDSISMSDLTLDYFMTQLLRYLEANKDALEKAPHGIHAVIKSNTQDLSAKEAKPGAIFFFRQNHAAENNINNPTHPFYFVYVQEDEGVRYGYINAHIILQRFENLSHGKTKPDNALCNAFNSQIKDNLEHYNKLIEQAVDHIKKAFSDTANKNLSKSRDTVLPTKSENPDLKNLELLTWLVITKPGFKTDAGNS